MNSYFITRGDINLMSTSGCEIEAYDFTEFFMEHDRNAEILKAYTFDLFSHKLRPWHKTYKKRYRLVKSRTNRFLKVNSPLLGYMFIHLKDLPDGIIYFPYSFYDYLSNIFLKRKTQIFVFAGHCLEMRTKYRTLRGIINIFVKIAFKLNKDTIYFQAINSEQREFVLKLGLPKENIFDIPVYIFPGTSFKEMPLLHNNSKKLKVLHIGGTSKNSIFLTEIFDKLTEANELDQYEFYLMGTRQPDEVVRYSKKYANVKILGYVDDVEKIKYLRQSDVVVVPANETFSTAAIEAMACGPIVISQENPAIKDMRDLGAYLFIVNTNDPAAFITAFDKIADLKKSPKILNKLRLENQRICKENYSSEVALRKMKDLFDIAASRYNDRHG